MSGNAVRFRWWGRADTGVGAGSRSRRGNRLRLRPTVLALEDRTLLSFTVLNTDDSGSGSLRYEVGLANAAGGTNTIDFNTNPALGTNFNTPQTITLTSGQLDVTDNGLTIMGPAAGVTVSGGGTSRIFAVESGVTAIIWNLTITDGSTQSDDYGGGLYNRGNLTLNNCTVSNDTAGGTYWGGGLYNTSGGTLTLNYCTVSNDTAGHYGGGLYNDRSTVNLNNCTFSHDSAGDDGGGLYAFVGATNLNNCTFSQDSTGDGGGGVYIEAFKRGYSSVAPSIMGCTLSDDSADYGGGLYITGSNSSPANVVNCTFSGDMARYGGGVYDDGFANLNLTACTVSGNIGTVGGGGVWNQIRYGYYGDLYLRSTIISGNTNGAKSPVESDLSGKALLYDYVTIGVPSAKLKLAPLGFYGGPTQTMPPLPDSAAIGVGGYFVSTDQRGFPLPSYRPDIGACQSQGGWSTTPVPMVVNSTSDPNSPPGTLSLAQP